MIKRITTFLLLSAATASFAEKKLSSEDFMKVVRQPRLSHAWAKLNGRVQHKRYEIKKDDKVIQKAMRTKANIYLGLLFNPDNMVGRVLFDDNELYGVGQVFASGIAGDTSEKIGCLKEKSNKMEEIYGISVADLSLSFLYWDLVKEHEKNSVSGLTCRVFELKNDKNKEFVRVWIYPNWMAPLKAQWFKQGEKKHYRQINFEKAKKVGDDMYMIEEFVLESNSWYTKVTFNDFSVSKSADKKPPVDLFPKLKVSKQEGVSLNEKK